MYASQLWCNFRKSCKFLHGKLPEEYFQETSSVHSYQTKFANMENYFIHRVSSNAGKKSISYRGASL